MKNEKRVLPCKHSGNIVWVSPDEKVIGVKGVRANCLVCGKRDKHGDWTPTVYLIER